MSDYFALYNEKGRIDRYEEVKAEAFETLKVKVNALVTI